MIPVVFDTNVFISALLAGRTPLAVLETARNEQSLLLITIEIVAEIEANHTGPEEKPDATAHPRHQQRMMRRPAALSPCPEPRCLRAAGGCAGERMDAKETSPPGPLSEKREGEQNRAAVVLGGATDITACDMCPHSIAQGYP